MCASLITQLARWAAPKAAGLFQKPNRSIHHRIDADPHGTDRSRPRNGQVPAPSLLISLGHFFRVFLPPPPPLCATPPPHPPHSQNHRPPTNQRTRIRVCKRRRGTLTNGANLVTLHPRLHFLFFLLLSHQRKRERSLVVAGPVDSFPHLTSRFSPSYLSSVFISPIVVPVGLIGIGSDFLILNSKIQLKVLFVCWRARLIR